MTQRRLERQEPGHAGLHDDFGLYSKRTGSWIDFT